MNDQNPYTPPSAAVEEPSVATKASTHRKKLIPLWIKVFGWIIMVMGVAVSSLAIVMAVLDEPVSYEIFGLSYDGSSLHPMALLIPAIILSLAISAYGLLFGRSWGLNACLATGYGGVVICLGTMVYSVVSDVTLTIRLELLIQWPYLLKLHKIKPFWRLDGH